MDKTGAYAAIRRFYCFQGQFKLGCLLGEIVVGHRQPWKLLKCAIIPEQMVDRYLK